MTAAFPKKLKFLFDRHPFKVCYGGRDGMKSWSFAQALVSIGRTRKIRCLCARETQKAMKESVHKLLSDTIERMGPGFQRHYTVQQERIFSEQNGSEFIFSGIKDAKNIKSYESCTHCWVEEAQVVSKSSWDILQPTIRQEGAEIWVSFNPELDTDETWKRWVLNPPPGAVVCKVGYEDNRWLSETSRTNIEHLKATDPISFDHIYGGNCRSSVEGAIFAGEIRRAVSEHRIGSFPYNKARPVETAWDLGFGDMTAIWFLQPYDGFYTFIDYLEGDGLTLADYLVKLQNKSYVYGSDWLPHDGVDTILHRKLAGGDRAMSIEQLMRAAGRRVRVAPKLYVADRINAARTIFGQSRFDQERCADGLQALRHYQWGPLNEQGVRKRDPLHNWASHGADAFCAAAVAVKQPLIERKQEIRVPPSVPRAPGPYTPFG